MKPLDFLETARDLATSSARRPRQTNLRRAVSTTYYALFHIDEAETVIRGFPAASAKDRRAFAVYLLLDIRT